MKPARSSGVPAACMNGLCGTQIQPPALRVVPPTRSAFSSWTTSAPPCRAVTDAA
jgi:hypothetical protein